MMGGKSSTSENIDGKGRVGVVKIFEVVELPVRYDNNGTLILDARNHIVLDVRGYGDFSKLENGDELQDKWGEFVAAAINKMASAEAK